MWQTGSVMNLDGANILSALPVQLVHSSSMIHPVEWAGDRVTGARGVRGGWIHEMECRLCGPCADGWHLRSRTCSCLVCLRVCVLVMRLTAGDKHVCVCVCVLLMWCCCALARFLQLWASEDMNTVDDLNGAGCWARILNQVGSY